MNSWIAYRDHSLFSFKVAVAKVGTQTKITSSGGSILPGHDYTEIDLEAPLQNKDTNFYQLAEKANQATTRENIYFCDSRGILSIEHYHEKRFEGIGNGDTRRGNS